MFNLLVGFILGIAVSTVGFSGMATILDKGVNSTKHVIQEQVKDK